MCGTCGCSDTLVQGDTESRKLESRRVQVEQNLMSKNDRFAQMNRQNFAQQNLKVFNLVSSPGSGKTSLLVKTIKALQAKMPIAVIEGDQQSEQDAERIRATGTPAVQINTGKGCHLEAQAIGQALEQLNLKHEQLLFIENVGNLVCPAAFDLGEQAKVVILSVTEGEDKPLKYPDMFKASQLMIVTKTDLLPYVDFDVQVCIEYARRMNPDLSAICLSSKTGEGMGDWLDWLQEKQEAPKNA